MKKQPTKAEEEKHRRKEKKGLHRKREKAQEEGEEEITQRKREAQEEGEEGITQKKRKTQEEGERRDRTKRGGGATKERKETHYLLGENKKALRTILHNIGTFVNIS